MSFRSDDFDRIAEDAGFTRDDGINPSPPGTWWLRADQGAARADTMGDGVGWRGLEATAFGHWGVLEPERLPPGADTLTMAETGVFDLHVAVAVYQRPDGCQVVVEVADPATEDVWRGVLGTLRLR